LQTACYLPWLKISVALRYTLTFPWTPRDMAQGSAAHSDPSRPGRSRRRGRSVGARDDRARPRTGFMLLLYVAYASASKCRTSVQ